MPSPASTPSLLSTLHSLQAQLPTPSTASALLNPHSQTVPLSSTQAQLTRDGLRETIAGMRTSLEKFKALWEGSGEEGRVRAAGLMREMTQAQLPLMSLSSTLAALKPANSSSSASLFPPPEPTPFALSSSNPATLLDRVAKSLSLEVYRESTPQDEATGDSTPAADPVAVEGEGGGLKETMVLGGKVLVVDVELDRSPAPALADSERGSSRWRIEKLHSTLALSSSTEPLECPYLDTFLRPALQTVLDHLAPSPTSTTDLCGGPRQLNEGEEETFELRGGRALVEFARRLRQVVDLEEVIAGKEEKGEDGRGDVFVKGVGLEREIRERLGESIDSSSFTPSSSSSHPWPTFSLLPRTLSATSPRTPSYPQLLHLKPRPTAFSVTAAPRLPDELLLTLPQQEPAASVIDPSSRPSWGWEAVFSPPLVIGVPTSRAGKVQDSWARVVLQQSRSSSTSSPSPIPEISWSPPSSSPGSASQKWTFASIPFLEGVAISRVGLDSVEEAIRVLQWARCWAFCNEFFFSIFDSMEADKSSAEGKGAVNDGGSVALSLEDLEGLLSAPPPCIPISLHLISPTESFTPPSIRLVIPSPDDPSNPITITITPPNSYPSSPHPKIELMGIDDATIQARLPIVAKELGGFGQGIVAWVLKQLASQQEAVGAQGGEKEKRKREEAFGAGESSDVEREEGRKRAKGRTED